MAREYLQLLEDKTREDHLRSVDELLAQVPTEFAAAKKQLEDAERFVFFAAAGELEKVSKLVATDWNLVHSVDRDGHTALHAAAAMNHVAVAELLLRRGGNPNTQDFEGYTSLHWAVENNAVDVVALLLSTEVDVTVRNSDRVTAFELVETLKPKHQPLMRKIISDYLVRVRLN